MSDVLDVELEDAQLIAEIDMVAELMVAASTAPGVLDQSAIDRILGVVPRQPTGVSGRFVPSTEVRRP